MRRALRLCLWILAAAVVALALLPFWMGPVLRGLGPKFGLKSAEYSRAGYGRFRLENATFVQPGVEVWIKSAEVDTPVLWLSRLAVGQERFVKVSEWKVTLSPTAPRKLPRPSVGWMPLRRQLLEVGRHLHRYLPSAEAGAGEVIWQGGRIALGSASWSNGTLTSPDLRWKDEVFAVRAEFERAPGVLQASAKSNARDFLADLTSREATVTGKLSVLSEDAVLEASFPETGWLPTRASLSATEWEVPGNRLGAPAYQSVNGSLTSTWLEGKFTIEADVSGRPVDPKKYPDLRVLVSAMGDRSSLSIEKLEITGPGMDARLSNSLRVSAPNAAAIVPANFHARVNLAQLPWLKGEGELVGNVEVQARGTGYPLVTFRYDGKSIGFGRWRAESVSGSGRLDWPRLVIDPSQVRIADQSVIEFDGDTDLVGKTIARARLQGDIPYSFVEPLIKQVQFSNARFAIHASGPWSNVRHEGTIEVNELLKTGFQPAVIRGWWKGEHDRIQESETGIQAGDSEVICLAAMTGDDSAEIRKLIWRHGGEDRLALERPAQIQWGEKGAIDALDLVGKAGELRLSGTWGRTGDIRFFARGIHAEWWSDFVPRTPFEWSIDSLSITGKWDNSPAVFDATGLLFLEAEKGERISVDLSLSGDGETLRLSRFRAVEKGAEFAQFTGELPLSVRPGAKPLVIFSPASQFEVNGFVSADAQWWSELGKRSGLHLHQPSLKLAMRGSVERPEGTAQLNVARIEFDERFKARNLPRVDGIQADITATGERLELKRLFLKVEGQAIEASGALPLDGEVRDLLRRDPGTALREHAEIRLKAERIEVAAFEKLVSEQLLPQGFASVDLSVSAKTGGSGYLRLEGLATRPLGALGPLRDISAELDVSGRTLRVQRVGAGLGGQPVTVTGTVNFPQIGQPQYDLAAKGENLPFVREAGMVMRGNVDLSLKSAGGSQNPVISGTVRMHDGLFVSDIRALIPKGGSGPQRRPPYFSITAPPFNRWRLDVDVEGDRFLRARTALFNGVASMKFHLLGNLENPRALGVLRIDNGQVLFPFAKFLLQDATVRLTEENPYDPQLGIFGTSRRYGYDLKLDLTGSASQPQLEFSSSPPLNSEQVLLLVMAGETPKKEVSYSTSQKFQRLGTFFGQSILGSLSGGGGEERLSISSGERISRQGRETYNVEYELDDRWSLTGEYDEFDEYNAGLKWKFLPRPRKEEDAKK